MRGYLRFSVVMLAAFAIVAIAGLGLAAPKPGERLNSHLLFDSATGAINSDIAFWGNKAYVGSYAGFRIFDISGTHPKLISSFDCDGPQNDPSVWDRNGDGEADILFLSVDRTMAGPECGSARVAHDDPDGWEGIRIFDVSDPKNPQYLTAVYQDCGSHTNTLIPDPSNNRVLLLNSSYPLRPGPTCGYNAPKRPLHGVIQVVEVSWDPLNPLGSVTATEIAELPINYPGDPDNAFDPAEHGLVAPPGTRRADRFYPLRACHDIAVFLPLGLVAAACAEQAQLWSLNPVTLLPDTANPLWVFDDPVDENGATGDPSDPEVAVDFWHSATFTWDGKVVNFIDESFAEEGCPTVTAIGRKAAEPNSDTGRMFFLDVATGTKLSHFFINRATAGDPISYCSAHLGNVVPTTDGRYLLVNAWYRGGADVIDFTDTTDPKEIAFFDRVNADNWSAYWYERDPAPGGTSLTIYGNDGVHDPATGAGFEVFKVFVGATTRVGVDHLNPQTQEFVLP